MLPLHGQDRVAVNSDTWQALPLILVMPEVMFLVNRTGSCLSSSSYFHLSFNHTCAGVTLCGK